MSKAWMPLYGGDYLGDTGHLSQGQHGAYLLLLMHYWQKELVPLDLEQCYTIAKARNEQGESNVRAVLSEFFSIDGEKYKHGRSDKELKKAHESFEKLSKAGKIGAKAKKLKHGLSDGKALNEALNKLSDSDSDSDKEEQIRGVASLYPKIADPAHLAPAVEYAIGEAIARHGFKVVQDGTKAVSDATKADPSKKQFLADPGKFFRSSDYMLSAKTDSDALPADYVPLSVVRKREEEEMKEQWLKEQGANA